MDFSNVCLDGFLPDPVVPGRGETFASGLYKKISSVNTPDFADMRKYSHERHDQRLTGSCVAQAVIKALEIKRAMAGKKHLDASVLALYYQCRQLMNPPKTTEDSGTYVRLAIHCLKKFGPMPEKLWPFEPDKYLHIEPPNLWEAMQSGYVNRLCAGYKIESYNVARVDDVIDALTAGCPVVYGTTVDDQWSQYHGAGASILYAVRSGESRGRHATCLVGWTGSQFIGENSWGPRWGRNGFYFMDPDVIADNDSQDFWAITEGYEPWEDN